MEKENSCEKHAKKKGKVSIFILTLLLLALFFFYFIYPDSVSVSNFSSINASEIPTYYSSVIKPKVIETIDMPQRSADYKKIIGIWEAYQIQSIFLMN